MPLKDDVGSITRSEARHIPVIERAGTGTLECCNRPRAGVRRVYATGRSSDSAGHEYDRRMTLHTALAVRTVGNTHPSHSLAKRTRIEGVAIVQQIARSSV